MSFLDIAPHMLIVFFVLIMAWLIADTVWVAMLPAFNTTGNEEMAATLDKSWNRTTDIADGTYLFLFLMIGIIGCVLTVFLAGHPIMLIAWLFINLVALFLYEIFNSYLTVFLAGDMNTGAMNTAAGFFQNGMPQALMILNMLMALIFLGKRGVIG